MARKARELSYIKSYAISFNAKTNLQFDTSDKKNFLNLLTNVKKNCFELLAYNLQDNAFYLFAYDIKISIDILLRRIAVKFAKFYNQRHNRSGKVFADRTTTSPAHTCEDALSMISKIHDIGSLQPTKFCSYKNYFENSNIDANFILENFDSQEEFYKFSKSATPSLIDSFQKKLSDDELEKYILDTYKLNSDNIQKLSQRKKENFVKSLIKLTKTSARQISRVTSLPLRFLWNLLKKTTTKGVKCENAQKEK